MDPHECELFSLSFPSDRSHGLLPVLIAFPVREIKHTDDDDEEEITDGYHNAESERQKERERKNFSDNDKWKSTEVNLSSRWIRLNKIVLLSVTAACLS